MTNRALRAFVCLVTLTLATHFVATGDACGSHRASIGEILFVMSPVLLALSTRSSYGLKLIALASTFVTAVDLAIRYREGPCLDIHGAGAIALLLGLALWIICSAGLAATLGGRMFRMLRPRPRRSRIRY